MLTSVSDSELWKTIVPYHETHGKSKRAANSRAVLLLETAMIMIVVEALWSVVYVRDMRTLWSMHSLTQREKELIMTLAVRWLTLADQLVPFTAAAETVAATFCSGHLTPEYLNADRGHFSFSLKVLKRRYHLNRRKRIIVNLTVNYTSSQSISYGTQPHRRQVLSPKIDFEKRHIEHGVPNNASALPCGVLVGINKNVKVRCETKTRLNCIYHFKKDEEKMVYKRNLTLLSAVKAQCRQHKTYSKVLGNWLLDVQIT